MEERSVLVSLRGEHWWRPWSKYSRKNIGAEIFPLLGPLPEEDVDVLPLGGRYDSGAEPLGLSVNEKDWKKCDSPRNGERGGGQKEEVITVLHVRS